MIRRPKAPSRCEGPHDRALDEVSDDSSDRGCGPLPVLVRPQPGTPVAHPALAAVLGELLAREAHGGRTVAYYEDAPYYEEEPYQAGAAHD